jgi:NTP pyrophosphatase (non-canonical NTP hydrolase)
MEERLSANDHKPGWIGELPSTLLRRLREEADELEIAFNARGHTKGDILREAADVANFAMMIADVCHALDWESDE